MSQSTAPGRVPRAKGSKRRCKHRPHGGYDHSQIQARRQRKGGLHWHGHVVTATHSDKRQTWPPTDYFKRLLEEARPNHAYPIRHKLKDCDMIKSFMVLRCLTRGTELDKDPGGRNTMVFPEEDAVMTVYEGCPSPPQGRRRLSKLSPGPLAHCSWGRRAQGCKGTNFPISLYIYEYVYYRRSKG
jgi:hypothetical protein